MTCYLYKNRIYFSLFDSIDNKEWLVNAQIGDYLKQNINDFSIILNWDNSKPSFTLHINGILADYVINPLFKQINGDLLIQSQNYIYQFGLIGEKIKQQQVTHQYQIRSIRRDYYETIRNGKFFFFFFFLNKVSVCCLLTDCCCYFVASSQKKKHTHIYTCF